MGHSIDPLPDLPTPDSQEGLRKACVNVRSVFTNSGQKSLVADGLVNHLVSKGTNRSDAQHAIVRLGTLRLVTYEPVIIGDLGWSLRGERGGYPSGPALIPDDGHMAWNLFNVIAADGFLGVTPDEIIAAVGGTGNPDPSTCGTRQIRDTGQAGKAKATTRKRSTEHGEAETKIVSGLTVHHKYENGRCLNCDPVGVRELAGKADVSLGIVSKFFKKTLGSHSKYRSVCRDPGKLDLWLRELNGELTRSIFFNSLDADHADPNAIDANSAE